MKKRLKFFIGFCSVGMLAGLLIFSGCDDEKPNPCKDKHPVTADFNIYETEQLSFPDYYQPRDTDTVGTFYVMFEAVEEDATYEWTLGAETITTRGFKRHSFPRGSNIEVSLKVNKTPDKQCFPDDDGEDFKTRIFYTTPNYQCDSRLNGTFEGFDEGEPNAKRTITIETCVPSPWHSNEFELRINNLIEGCSAFGFDRYMGGYKVMHFGGSYGSCAIAGSSAWLSKTSDSLRIEYNFVKDPANNDFTRIKKTFIGIRK